MRNLLLGLMIGAMALPASGQSVRAGIDAWQKGDTEGAVAIWRPLAEAGDADAAFNLGQAYRLGRGVVIDLAQAQNWLERAARKGHVDAQTTLEDYAAITAPTLLIVGGKTRAPTRAVIELLGATLPSATVETLRGAGHMSPFTHPAELNRLIVERLSLER